MSNVSETDLCRSQPDCDDEECAIEDKIYILDTDLSHMDTPTDGCSYYTTWTVSIALAVPRGEEADDLATPEKPKRTKADASSVLAKAIKSQSCLHIEYKLLPDAKKTIKVDVLVFGQVAKVFKDDDYKILRTWQEGDQTWAGWTHRFKIRINKDMLVSLVPHKIKLKIWNNKDKLSSQARLERPRAFKWSQDLPKDAGDDVMNMVNTLRALNKNSNTPRKHKCDTLLTQESELGSDTDKNLTSQVTSDFQKPRTDSCFFGGMKKERTTFLAISSINFVAGETSVTEHTTVQSPGVLEVMCHVSLDKPLMSDQLKTELNPLVITILTATSMPSSPIPHHVLQEKCLPVYCQYKFHDLNTHRTKYHTHDTNIYFRDVNVILTGLMSPHELQDFLSTAPLHIQVHDRDRKSEETLNPAELCDIVSDDDTQSHTGAFSHPVTSFNSYGVASLDLSELLLGKKSLKVDLPIKCGPPPPVLDRKRRVWGSNRDPIRQAHYYEANSQLKAKVELARPLRACEGPLGRIVYLLDYNNFFEMSRLREEILRINAAAFCLYSHSLENLELELHNNKRLMYFKHDEGKDLDFVTGFHVTDKKTHIFVIEGLKRKAVTRLREAVPIRLSGREEDQVIILYNSNLSFFKRIYDTLPVSLSPIYLYEPLPSIMMQPLVYIRGMVPQPCFQALSRLNQLCQTRQLKEVVQYNLFPSAEMIVSMSKECGVSAEQWKRNIAADAEVELPSLPVRMKRHAPLDNHNSDYIRWQHNCQQRPGQHLRDYVQGNIETVHDQSQQLPKSDAEVLRIDEADFRPSHNYSTQTYNSNQQTRKQLTNEMAKMPGRRFTYSQQYQGATVEPGDVPPEKDYRATSTGWFTSLSGECLKAHPKRPDDARVEELKKPWRENILHAGILKPTLSRDIFEWQQRNEDFQLYGKPQAFFNTHPLSIQLAGESLRQEQLQAATAQYGRWRKKLLPASDSSRPGADRIPQFKCHMRGKSEPAQDILKDKPKKYSLRKPGLKLTPVPALSVMNLAENKGAFQAMSPGACRNCSLTSKNNAIPRNASVYERPILFGQESSFLYKRSAMPLTDEERSVFSFRM